MKLRRGEKVDRWSGRSSVSPWHNGGILSGEHEVGVLKRPYFEHVWDKL